MVVQVRERKIRFRLVDQEERRGMARKEPRGRAREERMAAMFGVVWRVGVEVRLV